MPRSCVEKLYRLNQQSVLNQYLRNKCAFCFQIADTTPSYIISSSRFHTCHIPRQKRMCVFLCVHVFNILIVLFDYNVTGNFASPLFGPLTQIVSLVADFDNRDFTTRKGADLPRKQQELLKI